MGRGVRVATDDGHPRQGESAFGSHHVDDAVLGVHHAEVGQPKLLGVACQGIHLRLTHGVIDGFILIVGGRVMVGHTVDFLGTEALQSPFAHPFEGLRTGHLVAIEAVDIELCGTILYLLNHVGVPNLIK